jgi:hypothetical protein
MISHRADVAPIFLSIRVEPCEGNFTYRFREFAAAFVFLSARQGRSCADD